MSKTSEKLRVLVIESNQDYLGKLKTFFSEISKEAAYIEPTFCIDASDAIGYVEENRHDILLIDDDMQGLPAIELLLFIETEDNQCKSAKKIVRKTGNRVIPKDQVDAFMYCDAIIDKDISSLEPILKNVIEELEKK